MPKSAVLLMDLQVDFLAVSGARMPVAPADAKCVMETANAVLDGEALSGALPVLIVNHFPRSDRIANFFRRYAALEGTPGADLDERLHSHHTLKVLAKSQSSAFSNPELNEFLRANEVQQLYVFGVFAEGCVRATAQDARRLGYSVTVPVDAIGSNATIKRRFAQWAMRRAGVVLVPTFLTVRFAT